MQYADNAIIDLCNNDDSDDDDGNSYSLFFRASSPKNETLPNDGSRNKPDARLEHTAMKRCDHTTSVRDSGALLYEKPTRENAALEASRAMSMSRGLKHIVTIDSDLDDDCSSDHSGTSCNDDSPHLIAVVAVRRARSSDESNHSDGRSIDKDSLCSTDNDNEFSSVEHKAPQKRSTFLSATSIAPPQQATTTIFKPLTTDNLPSRGSAASHSPFIQTLSSVDEQAPNSNKSLRDEPLLKKSAASRQSPVKSCRTLLQNDCSFQTDSDSDSSYLFSPSGITLRPSSHAAKFPFDNAAHPHAKCFTLPRSTPKTPSTDVLTSYQPVPRVLQRIPASPLLMTNFISGKLYPDLRHVFVHALLKHAEQSRQAIHERTVFDATLRALVILSLFPYAIRSAEAASRIKGIGTELLSVLQAASRTASRCCDARGTSAAVMVGNDADCVDDADDAYCQPAKGKFSTVAPAALLSLLRHEAENPQQKLCPMENLMLRINSLVDIRYLGVAALDRPVQYYLDKNVLDPGWGQVRKLCCGNIYAGLEQCMKERKNRMLSPGSGILFELLDPGRTIAQKLQASFGLIPRMGPLRQLAASSVEAEYGDVTMIMDVREGGGGSKSLHKMCNLLDEHCVPYVVRELKISDYVYFVGDKLAPILVERKTVDDVACSLADGRWERQQRNMRKAQYVLGGGDARRCQICYLIEGDANKRTVHGGNVGQHRWNQSLTDIENAIESLPDLGFSVMRSKSLMGSMLLLARIARDVSWKFKNGSIDCTMTYDEFLEKIHQCIEKEGDPPNDKRHQNPAPPVLDSASINSLPLGSRSVNNLDVDSAKTWKKGGIEDIAVLQNDVNNKYLKELEASTIAELKLNCKERGEKQTGSKLELILRLSRPRRPEILISRARRGQYVPKIPSCNAALLVALLLNHRPGTDGLPKERLMMLAEETGVSKETMGGNGGWYDGWAGMRDMTKGDPALVCMLRQKYSLTTQPAGNAGLDVAQALHVLAHQENVCLCGAHVATTI